MNANQKKSSTTKEPMQTAKRKIVFEKKKKYSAKSSNGNKIKLISMVETEK